MVLDYQDLDPSGNRFACWWRIRVAQRLYLTTLPRQHALTWAWILIMVVQL